MSRTLPARMFSSVESSSAGVGLDEPHKRQKALRVASVGNTTSDAFPDCHSIRPLSNARKPA